MGAPQAEDRDTVWVAPEAAHAERTRGHLAVPTSGEGPGLIVLDGGLGLTSWVRTLCERFAREGYIAYAPDLYDGRDASLVPEGERRPLNASFDHVVPLLLRAVDRVGEVPGLSGDTVGAFGVGPGGARAMLLAELRPERVSTVTTYYGLEPDLHYASTRAAFLGHFASNDETTSWKLAQDHLERIRSAGREGEFHLYPRTVAGFFEAERASAYRADAADLSWSRTVAFLRDRLSRG